MTAIQAENGLLSVFAARLIIRHDSHRASHCDLGGALARVARRVKQDLEPLPGPESGSIPGREAQEPRSQDLVFRAQLRQLLVEKVDLGGQWPLADCTDSLEVVGLADPP